jgi:hypothetical protein
MAIKPQQCAPGEPCVNVERLSGEVHGEIKLFASKIQDLRAQLSELPRQVTQAIRAERESVGGKLTRGEGHFDEIFRRLNRIEKQILAMWVLVVVIGLGEAGKVIAWLAPIVKGMIP